MIVSILGCGWFGLHFAKSLLREGHDVKGSTTSADKMQLLQDASITPYLIDLSADDFTSAASFFECDVLVIAVPPKVRSAAPDDYLVKMRRVIEECKIRRVSKVIFISSTSVFGSLNGHVHEQSIPAPDTLSGQVLLDTEKLFAAEKSFVTTVVRFAGLVGPGRDPGRFFAGKVDIANGLAPVNLLHQEDCSGICLAILKQDAFGYTIHGCAPDHPERRAFYGFASRSAGLQEPVFVEELTEWKVVDSMYAEALLSYRFVVSDWFAWLSSREL